MMLSVTPFCDGEDQGEGATILSNFDPPHSSSNTDITHPTMEDSDNGFDFANDGNTTDNTDEATEIDTDSESDIESDDADGTEPYNIDIPSNGGRPEDWNLGAYLTLRSLMTKAKGAASKHVVRFIKEHLKGTKLIFVVGQSGTGKSSLLKELTGLDITIGKSHRSGTEEYEVCPAMIEGEQYLFVDTAGFGAGDKKDMDSFYDVVSCLDALAPFVTIAGVLFVYGGTQDRMHAHDLTTIQWVKCFCGPEFYKYITVVTTKWDTLREEAFKEAWARFAGVTNDAVFADILRPAPAGTKRYDPGSVYHHGIEMDDANPDTPLRCLPKETRAKERAECAKAMIMKRYSTKPQVELQVVREMAAKVLWYETEAARVLSNSHLTTKLNMRGGFLCVTVIPDKKPAKLNKKPKARRTASTLPAAPIVLALPPPNESCWTKKPAEASPKPKVRKTASTLPAPLVVLTHPPAGKSKNPWTEQPRRSWYVRLWDWLEKAKELAAFFQEQQRRAAQNKGYPPRPNAWVMMVGTLMNWWSGPRESKKEA